jgi:hypothetical protein
MKRFQPGFSRRILRHISKLCSPLQEAPSPFLYGRNPECLFVIHTCELYLSFLSFEAFETQNGNACSLLHLALFVRTFAKLKRRMMALRNN